MNFVSFSGDDDDEDEPLDGRDSSLIGFDLVLPRSRSLLLPILLLLSIISDSLCFVL